LIGNETDGLNRHYFEICDVTATIPQSENSAASSVNVSCAAAIMFYEAVRQRNFRFFDKI
jgi:TrmH family RNA methyltransferase